MKTQNKKDSHIKNSYQRIANASLFIGSILVSLISIEVGLRLVGFSYPTFQAYDDKLGMVLRPNVQGWYREEGEAFVAINSQGWHDSEHSLEKPAGTFRIAVLGDSFADAYQVPMKDTFWSVLGERLAECGAFGGRKIEMLNFGVSGYGTAQELLVLQQHVWKYDPDLVLLAFLTGNDINDNAKAFATNYRPYFRYENGALVLDTSFVETDFYQSRKSMLWQFFVHASDRLRIVQAVNLIRNRINHRTSKGLEFALYEETYLKPITSDWEEAWKVTEGLILKIRDEVMSKSKQLLLVILSNGIQVHPDKIVRKQFMDRVASSDLFYPDRRLEDFAREAGIPVIALAPMLLEYAETYGKYLHGFANTRWGAGHWNQLGHAIAGQNIANYLCRQPIAQAY